MMFRASDEIAEVLWGLFGLCQAVSHGAGFVWVVNCGGDLRQSYI